MLALEIVIGALQAEFGVPVASKVPMRLPPGPFIRVEASGAQAYSPRHDQTGLIIQVYGRWEQLDEIVELMGRVRDFLRFTLPTVELGVLGWEEDFGPYEFLDPMLSETHSRWQLTGDLYQTND